MTTYYTLQGDTLSPTTDLMDARGFAYADGFFSTLGVNRGQILWFDLHKQRLTKGATQFAFDVDMAVLDKHLQALAKQLYEGIIKIIITRQPQAVRGYGFVNNLALIHIKTLPSPLYQTVSFIQDFPIQPPTKAITLSATLGIRPPQFAGLKLISSHEQIFAHQQLLSKQKQHPDLGEGLVANVDKLWISGTTSNVFYRLGGAWHTPFVDKSGVSGVARRALLAIGNVHERQLSDDDLPHLTGLFFSNAVRGIMPIDGLYCHDDLLNLDAYAFQDCL